MASPLLVENISVPNGKEKKLVYAELIVNKKFLSVCANYVSILLFLLFLSFSPRFSQGSFP